MIIQPQHPRPVLSDAHRRRRPLAASWLLAVVVLLGSLLVGTASATISASTTSATSSSPVTAASSSAYWLMTGDGGISSFGTAGSFGSVQGQPLNHPTVCLSSTADGGGYWEVASDGGIFSFGDAGFYGSTGNLVLNSPIVGMAATPDGGGYWLVASDGGIFAFGDAKFFGSTGGIALNSPIVGMASTPDGGGYWLAARDGGIFTFGDATFDGSLGGMRLDAPIIGMASTPDGGGYWLAGQDGGVFSFGDAQFAGSLGGTSLSAPVIGLAVPGKAGGCSQTYVPPSIASPGPGGPAGEGQWTPTGRSVENTAAVYTTTLRPYVGGQSAGVAWIDMSRSSLSLYAGPPSEPAGNFTNSGLIAPADRPNLLAAFNGGFMVAASNGGWYSQGQTAVPLVNGAASVVMYNDGSIAIGMWGRDFSLNPNIASVRQNLTLMVDGGQVAGNIFDGGAWGAVINGVGNTWRSGIGVDKYGNLIYIAGNGLYPWDLAQLLVAAGAVEAMQLDINPQWPVFTTYTTAAGQPASSVVGSNLVPGMFYGPDHFFNPVNRDFFAVFAK